MDNFIMDYCSLVDDGSRESKTKIYNATMGSNFALKDYVGQTVEIEDIVMFKKSIVDAETGIDEESEITSIITKDGILTTNSKTVKKSLNNMMEIFGKPHYEEPLKIGVFTGKTKKGLTFVDVKPV